MTAQGPAARAEDQAARGEPRAPRIGGEPLIDAQTAGRLLGVPHTWVLAQARARRIPHHRLGHYVRFRQSDLEAWLGDTREDPDGALHV